LLTWVLRQRMTNAPSAPACPRKRQPDIRCRDCKLVKPRAAFTRSQARRGREARCQACTAALPSHQHQHQQPTNAADAATAAAVRDGMALERSLDCPIPGAIGKYWGKRLRPRNWGYSQHVDALWGMTCFAEIVRLRIFPDAKDVSESMGALRAATLHCDIPMLAKAAPLGAGAGVSGAVGSEPFLQHGFRSRWRAGGVWCVSIGDGCTPRTAALVSFLTSWDHVISVDPCLHHEFVGCEPKGIRGLTGARDCFEDWLPKFAQSAEGAVARAQCVHLIVLCVHSHHRFRGEGSFDKLRAAFGTPPTCVVALPCCPTFHPTKDIGREPDITFEDPCVFSACRSIDVWNFA